MECSVCACGMNKHVHHTHRDTDETPLASPFGRATRLRPDSAPRPPRPRRVHTTTQAGAVRCVALRSHAPRRSHTTRQQRAALTRAQTRAVGTNRINADSLSSYAHRRAAVSRHGSDPTLSNLSASSCTNHKTQERIASRASRSNTDLARTNARPVAALNNDSYPRESRFPLPGSCAA